VAAVRRCIKLNIFRASLDPAIEGGLQGFVTRIRAIERKIVAKDNEPPWLAAQQRHEARQPLDVLAVYLDQFERRRIRRSGKPRID
jgi:hypothetical protein